MTNQLVRVERFDLQTTLRELPRDPAWEIDWRSIALTDHLTRVGNRLALELEFPRHVEVVTSRSEMTMVGLVDGDGIHDLNEQLGHASGDEVIGNIAHRLALLFPGRVYRLGGDEYVLLGSARDLGEVQGHRRRIVRAFRTPLVAKEAVIRVRVSVGLAVGMGCSELGSLLREADDAMYRCKARRRNTRRSHARTEESR